MTDDPHNPQHQQAPADDVAPARKAPETTGKPDQLNMDERKAENHQEALIDESLEETFPASDPPTAKNIT
jgi:hypothetical protein